MSAARMIRKMNSTQQIYIYIYSLHTERVQGDEKIKVWMINGHNILTYFASGYLGKGHNWQITCMTTNRDDNDDELT